MKAALLLIGILPATAWSQARLVIEDGGRRVGYATISQKLLPDGTKSVEMRLQIGKTRLVTQSTFDREGAPTRKFHEILEPVADKKRVLVEFDAEGAVITDLGGPDRTPRKAPLVKTGNRKNASEFWFLRDQPKPGARAQAFVFDLNTWSWDLTTSEYVGKAKGEIAGKMVDAHEVRADRAGGTARMLLDAQGLPILVEQGRLVMRRFQ